MDKLLQLAEKLRQAIVPERPVTKMSKAELLEFIEEKSVVDRMKIYYGKQEGKKLKSKIHEAVEKEEALVPELNDFRNMRVSKIRKVLKTWHKDTQITSKLHSHSAPKLRSMAKRHMWEEMLYHDESLDFGDEEEKRHVVEEKKKTPRKKRSRTKSPRGRSPGKATKTPGVTVIMNNESSTKKDCSCGVSEEEEPDDPMKKILYRLAPNLYKTAISKSFILDLCNLDRMRQEGRQCPPDCRRAATDPNKCCFQGYGVGGVGVGVGWRRRRRRRRWRRWRRWRRRRRLHNGSDESA